MRLWRVTCQTEPVWRTQSWRGDSHFAIVTTITGITTSIILIILIILMILMILWGPIFLIFEFFSRMRSEGSRFTWGSGGEAVFAEFCVCVRNRSQVSATVCVSAVRLSTVASVSGVVSKACQVELWRRSYIGVCRGGVCESDLWRRSYIGVCRGGV